MCIRDSGKAAKQRMATNAKKAVNHLYDLSVFIFRRDLRLEDNRGLIQSLKLSGQVFPCFIFDTNQIDSSKNEYFSNNCVQFMVESLEDLNKTLVGHKSRLFYFKGSLEDSLRTIVSEVKPNAIFINEDVTPYAIKRDNLVAKICSEHKINFHSYQDCMLLEKEKVLLHSGEFYKKFTPYWRVATTHFVDTPQKLTSFNFVTASFKLNGDFPSNQVKTLFTENLDIEVHGGRTEGMKIINNIKKFKNYLNTRNFPSLPSTKLSAYNKFGCMSIREIYHTICNELGKSHELVRQLYWRDFYYNVVFYYPHVVGDSMKEIYRGLDWDNNLEHFQAWKEGKTGFPIVDAAMRHLNKTGYMPNRLRMVVSMFLTKDLLIDWRWGEKYFAQKLVDIDLAQNNGGWQWSSSTGVDSQPYFRIFNPKLQSEKFDKDCVYMLKWLPELKKCVSKDHIHDWEAGHKFYKEKKIAIDYPDPIIKHDIQKKKALELFGAYKTNGKKVEEEEELGEDDDEDGGVKTKNTKRRIVGPKSKESTGKGSVSGKDSVSAKSTASTATGISVGRRKTLDDSSSQKGKNGTLDAFLGKKKVKTNGSKQERLRYRIFIYCFYTFISSVTHLLLFFRLSCLNQFT
eukprot:TRINITY_DN3338_c0_g6_i2.p1 TRINITY_DN3338_c0_g6~~TRINITY_DN3338_c0_g6_i2.p1  ORF type:complete len:641 (+),score=88.60 TRINITY_DN3338_c0_g6_i2:49-1923(+)